MKSLETKIINSDKKNNLNSYLGIILMLISSFLVSFGQFFWKIGVDKSIWYIIIGFILYGLGALLMIIAYRFGEVSKLQPLLAFGYIVSLVVGYFYFKEQINIFKIFGILSIILGVIILSLGSKKNVN